MLAIMKIMHIQCIYKHKPLDHRQQELPKKDHKVLISNRVPQRYILDKKRNNKIVSRFMDIYKENAHSNETQALTKNIDMNIQVLGTLCQLFIRGYNT